MALNSVVIDTNVIVSGIAYPGSNPGRLLAAWRAQRLNLVVSHFIVDEVARVLPGLAKSGLTKAEARDLGCDTGGVTQGTVPFCHTVRDRGAVNVGRI